MTERRPPASYRYDFSGGRPERQVMWSPGRSPLHSITRVRWLTESELAATSVVPDDYFFSNRFTDSVVNVTYPVPHLGTIHLIIARS